MQIVQLPLLRVRGGGHNAEHILHTTCHNKSGNASLYLAVLSPSQLVKETQVINFCFNNRETSI